MPNNTQMESTETSSLRLVDGEVTLSCRIDCPWWERISRAYAMVILMLFPLLIGPDTYSELILKLNLMNRNQLTPNDNRAGELNQGKIIALLLLIAHQQFSEAVHMRMKHLDNPSACFKVRIFLFCFLFFSTGHNVRLIVVGGHDILLSRVTSVKAKILRTLLCHFRACNHNAVQSIRQ